MTSGEFLCPLSPADFRTEAGVTWDSNPTSGRTCTRRSTAATWLRESLLHVATSLWAGIFIAIAAHMLSPMEIVLLRVCMLSRALFSTSTVILNGIAKVWEITESRPWRTSWFMMRMTTVFPNPISLFLLAGACRSGGITNRCPQGNA